MALWPGFGRPVQFLPGNPPPGSSQDSPISIRTVLWVFKKFWEFYPDWVLGSKGTFRGPSIVLWVGLVIRWRHCATIGMQQTGRKRVERRVARERIWQVQPKENRWWVIALESRMLVECLRGDIVDMGTLKDTSTQLCGLTNRILADEEKIHTILTCLNCIYLILKRWLDDARSS